MTNFQCQINYQCPMTNWHFGKISVPMVSKIEPLGIGKLEINLKLVIGYLTLACFLLCCSTAAAEDWKELKGEHFIVYYLDDREFASDVMTRAEQYYNTVASDLGYSRYDSFWQWDKRVKIYIYRTAEEFRKAAGISKEWPVGMARYKEKEIISYKWSAGFVESLLPHEITHLVFRDFVGDKNNIPLWLEEGVAVREEEGRRPGDIELVKKLVREKSYIAIELLTKMDIRNEPNAEAARKFYAEAVSIVNFLMEKYGVSRFTLFCRQLRDGRSIDEAISSVYTGYMGNMGDLEKRWVEYYEGEGVKWEN